MKENIIEKITQGTKLNKEEKRIKEKLERLIREYETQKTYEKTNVIYMLYNDPFTKDLTYYKEEYENKSPKIEILELASASCVMPICFLTLKKDKTFVLSEF